MDIQLQASRYLLVLRIVFLSLAVVAVAASNLHDLLKALLAGAVILQLFGSLSENDAVAGLQSSEVPDCESRNPDQKIILKLRSSRRIEVTLKMYYCLWWVQILYLHSSQASYIVFVLPDNCTVEERRRLRQFLNQRH